MDIHGIFGFYETARLRACDEDQRRLSETGRMAPKKRRGSGASKQNEKSKQRHAHASVIDDGDDADMEVCRRPTPSYSCGEAGPEKAVVATRSCR